MTPPVPDRHSLQGRTALVTGAAAGIGRATAVMMSRRGARVIALDVDKDGVAETVEEIRAASGAASAIHADLRDPESFGAIFAQVRAESATLDILANVAGITRWLGMHETRVEDWGLINDINARAPFFLMQRASELMIESGRGGAIVNVSSIAGKGFKNTSAAAYAASKAAVIAVSRVASGYLAPHRIRVNSICPGPTRTHLLMEGLDLFTERTGRTIDEEFDAWVEQVPLGFAAEADDMAEAICFLASDAGRFVTGQAWNIDGGMVFD